MNCSDHRSRPNPAVDEGLLAELLVQVRGHFYSTKPAAVFQRDRRRLLYALSWPAAWLTQRGLFCSPARYRALVVARLDAIRGQGDPACYGPYFPAYLLKCLQDFFDHHDDELHAEFRHIRNALEVVGGSLRSAENVTVQARQIETLASVHRLLRTQAPPPSDPRQLPLF
jgi:hypothetical protein